MADMNWKWREALFNQAKKLGLDGALFQNPMELQISDLVFELAAIDERRKEINNDLDQYAASIRTLVRESSHD